MSRIPLSAAALCAPYNRVKVPRHRIKHHAQAAQAVENVGNLLCHVMRWPYYWMRGGRETMETRQKEGGEESEVRWLEKSARAKWRRIKDKKRNVRNCFHCFESGMHRLSFIVI